MKTLLVLFILLSISILLILLITKNKNKSESKLTVYEHPSSFEKPGIEMVDNQKVLKKNQLQVEANFKDFQKDESDEK